jgi:hypothetical protein
MTESVNSTLDLEIIQKGFKRVRTSYWFLIFSFLLTLIADGIYIAFIFIHGIDWVENGESLGLTQYYFLIIFIAALGTLLQLIGIILFIIGQKKYADYNESSKGAIKASRILAIIYLIIFLIFNLLRFAVLGPQFEIAGDLQGIVAPIVYSIYILLLSLAIFFSISALKKMKNEKGIPSKTMITHFLLFLPVVGQLLAIVFSFIAGLNDTNFYTFLFSIAIFDLLVIITSINCLIILKKEEIKTIS